MLQNVTELRILILKSRSGSLPMDVRWGWGWRPRMTWKNQGARGLSEAEKSMSKAVKYKSWKNWKLWSKSGILRFKASELKHFHFWIKPQVWQWQWTMEKKWVSALSLFLEHLLPFPLPFLLANFYSLFSYQVQYYLKEVFVEKKCLKHKNKAKKIHVFSTSY